MLHALSVDELMRLIYVSNISNVLHHSVPLHVLPGRGEFLSHLLTSSALPHCGMRALRESRCVQNAVCKHHWLFRGFLHT